jgi:hypothetical protein
VSRQIARLCKLKREPGVAAAAIEVPEFGMLGLIVGERLIAVERPFDGGPLSEAQQLWAAGTTEVAIVFRTINLAAAAPTTVVEFTGAGRL